jgi:signal peptide peptidase SppA
MNFQLLSAIFRHPWAIDEQSALGYGPLISNLVNGGSVQLDGIDEKPFTITGTVEKGSDEPQADPDTVKKSVRVIPISGPLMKNDQFCGPTGMSTIAGRIKEADNDKSVDAIVLKIESPGGTVDGTIELASAVTECKKPVVTYVDGLMASAALWIGICADEVIASTEFDRIGSVGVLLSFADMKPAYELQGVKFHQISSSLSPDKTRRMDELLRGDYEGYRKEVLDPLADNFINHVKENRPGVKEEHLTGKVFFARDVMGVFVDRIGKMTLAISRALELSVATNTKKNKEMSKENNIAHTALMGVIGVESLETSDEGVYMSNDQLAAINTALQAAANAEHENAAHLARLEGLAEGETVADLLERISGLEEGETVADLLERISGLEEGETVADLLERISGLEEGETVATLRARISEQEATITRLENEPPAQETIIGANGDDDGVVSDPQAMEYHEISKVLNPKN